MPASKKSSKAKRSQKSVAADLQHPAGCSPQSSAEKSTGKPARKPQQAGQAMPQSGREVGSEDPQTDTSTEAGQPPARRPELLVAGEGDHQEKLAYCQERIGYQFKDPQLLLEALTHASSAAHRLASNERLEFLGDAILGMVVCDWLYHEFPEYSEGDLTKIKSNVVSRKTCAGIARQLHLERCLIVGRGVTRNRSFPKSLVSDVFESVVAAVYLDGGLEPVCKMLREWLSEEVQQASSSQGAGNHKSQLQQLAQRDLGDTPNYHLLSETGPDHNKSFQVMVIIGKQLFAPAWGRNKKEAEQRAAGNALAELEGNAIPFPETL